MRYKDAKFFPGKFIRWMIMDKDGTSVYCDQCGNIANGVLFEPCERYILSVPLCRQHIELWHQSHPDYNWDEHALALIQPEVLLRLAAQKDKEIDERCSLNS